MASEGAARLPLPVSWNGACWLAHVPQPPNTPGAVGTPAPRDFPVKGNRTELKPPLGGRKRPHPVLSSQPPGEARPEEDRPSSAESAGGDARSRGAPGRPRPGRRGRGARRRDPAVERLPRKPPRWTRRRGGRRQSTGTVASGVSWPELMSGLVPDRLSTGNHLGSGLRLVPLRPVRVAVLAAGGGPPRRSAGAALLGAAGKHSAGTPGRNQHDPLEKRPRVLGEGLAEKETLELEPSKTVPRARARVTGAGLTRKGRLVARPRIQQGAERPGLRATLEAVVWQGDFGRRGPAERSGVNLSPRGKHQFQEQEGQKKVPFLVCTSLVSDPQTRNEGAVQWGTRSAVPEAGAVVSSFYRGGN